MTIGKTHGRNFEGELRLFELELDLVRAELSEAREIVKTLFVESTASDPRQVDENGLIKFDHADVQVFRYAQSKLIDWKMIDESQCTKS